MPAVFTLRRTCRRLWLHLLAVTAAGVLTAVVVCAPAIAAPPVVIPPLPGVHNVLAVNWWQYVLGQPTATNPLLDATGANCALGQSGPVFFLVGVSGSGTANRTACVVHGPRALFLPLSNVFDVHTPGDGNDTPEAVYFNEFLTFHFRVDTIHASVDGVPVPGLSPVRSPFRACAAPVAGCFPRSFPLQFPDGNLFGLPAGTYKPAVQDGFYLLLAPLAPGVHTISFGGTGSFQDAPSVQDITYHLTVTR